MTVLARRRTPAGASVAGSKRATTARIARRPGQGDDAVGADPEAVELREGRSRPRRSDGRARRGRGGRARRIRATATIDPSARNPYDERSKIQAGSANSASIGASGSSRGPSTQPVQVPPAAPVADEVEDPVRRPLGLDDRLRPGRRRRASTRRACRPVAIGATRRRVASHGMSGWSHSSQASRVPSGESRGEATKSGPLDEDRRVAAVERDGHDRARPRSPARRRCGPRGPRRTGAVARSGRRSRVAPRAGRRDRRPASSAPGVEPVQPAVGEVREDDDPAGDDVRAAAVLVDAAPDVERRRASGPRSSRPPPRGRGRGGRPPSGGPRASRRRRRRSTARRGRRRRRRRPRSGSASATPRTGATRAVGHPFRSRAARRRRTRPARGSSARA